MRFWKYFLRTFGLVTIDDVWKALDVEADYYEKESRKRVPKNIAMLQQSISTRHQHTAESCRNMKPVIYLINAWWIDHNKFTKL